MLKTDPSDSFFEVARCWRKMAKLVTRILSLAIRAGRERDSGLPTLARALDTSQVFSLIIQAAGIDHDDAKDLTCGPGG